MKEYWDRNWFIVLVGFILLSVALTGWLSAKHSETMAERYRNRVMELERQIGTLQDNILRGESEWASRWRESEKRFIELQDRWETLSRRFDVPKRPVPSSTKETVTRLRTLGYQARVAP